MPLLSIIFHILLFINFIWINSAVYITNNIMVESISFRVKSIKTK